jgi:hypothetical protein
MPRQPDLFGPAPLTLRPEQGRSEPRLWVRRLVIWAAPDGPALREVSLRPGLNIVWSPDGGDTDGREAASLGHGAGKTLFCRLLRYVLGEERYCPDAQRDNILSRFPDGQVGAEVVIEGRTWAVLRPLAPVRRHFAVPDARPEELLAGTVEPTGIAPLLRELETRVLSPEVSALVPVEAPASPWQVALAWLARDQECRFDKPLDWRAATSDSDSPVRNMSVERVRDSMRALIGAIDPEEFRLRHADGVLESKRSAANRDLEHRRWETDGLLDRLVRTLTLDPAQLPPGRLAIEPLRTAARRHLARQAQVQPNVDVNDIEHLRNEAEKARQRQEQLERGLERLDAQIPEIDALIARIQGEVGVASAGLMKAGHTQCPICEVPIDRALAEGCKLSHKLPNLEQARAESARLRDELEHEKKRLQAAKDERDALNRELATTRPWAESTKRRVDEAQRLRTERQEAWYSARRLTEEVDRLEHLLAEQEQQVGQVASLNQGLEALRQRSAAYRETQSDVIGRFSGFFDAIIRFLVGQGATGRITLDGIGLKTTVELGGERSTAAIDSLKVVAFDLAALCMGIQG